jgi:hypothetical protein
MPVLSYTEGIRMSGVLSEAQANISEWFDKPVLSYAEGLTMNGFLLLRAEV